MPIPLTGVVGLPGASSAPGASPAFSQGNLNEMLVSELQGRFYSLTYKGLVYSAGMGLTSINNATFSTGTLGNTCTPILGVWNPSSSTVNVVLLQAILAVALTALQATSGGPFVWASSVGNTAITTGSAGFNRKTLAAAGGSGKAFAASPALTGLTNNLVVQEGSGAGGGALLQLSSLQTAAGFLTPAAVATENFDGSLIVPPGGVFALLATITPVATSAAGKLVWAEVPV